MLGDALSSPSALYILSSCLTDQDFNFITTTLRRCASHQNTERIMEFENSPAAGIADGDLKERTRKFTEFLDDEVCLQNGMESKSYTDSFQLDRARE